MGLINGIVTLEKNYNEWKRMYEEEKNNLIKLFNKDSFKIEHVGSTSVKNLSAKPIIDIAVGVNYLKEIDKYKELLSLNYTIKENYEKNEILLIKEHNNETFFLIHILPINDDRYKNMIKFRDILINNPKILKEYEKLKKELAEKYHNDRTKYTSLKNEFINNIIKNTNN
jgi:GrpB-like predicted nucleotidyltransferase (UPF0157 family)